MFLGSLKLKLLLILSLTISGCQLFSSEAEEPLRVETVERPIAIHQPPRPSPVSLVDVQWYVITSDNYSKKKKQIEKVLGGDFVVFAMIPKDYENWTYNYQELRRAILEHKNLVEYYEENTSSERLSTRGMRSRPSPSLSDQ